MLCTMNLHRTLLASVLGLALWVPASFAQIAEQPTAPEPDDNRNLLFGGDPELKFDSIEYDFGRILDDKEVEGEFRFKNAGKAPLKIADVRASCGCTVPEMSKKEYAAGEPGVVKFKFNPHGKQGQQAKSITVTSNDPKSPSLVLTLKANITAIVMVDPPQLFMGQVEKRTEIHKTTVIYGRKEDFKVLEATNTGPDVLKIVVGEPKRQKFNGEDVTAVEIAVDLKPDAVVGRHQCNIGVKTNESARAFVTVPVMVEVMGDLNTNPARLALGVIEIDKPYQGETKIARKDGKPFKITETKAVSDAGGELGMKIDAVPSPDGNGYTIKLSGATGDKPARFSGKLVIGTDVVGEERVEVPYYLTVRAKPGTTPPAGPARPRSESAPNLPQSPTVAPANPK